MCWLAAIAGIIAFVILAVYAFGASIIFVGGTFGYPLMYVYDGEVDDDNNVKFTSPFGGRASAPNLLSAIMQGLCRGLVLGMLWPLWVDVSA